MHEGKLLVGNYYFYGHDQDFTIFIRILAITLFIKINEIINMLINILSTEFHDA